MPLMSPRETYLGNDRHDQERAQQYHRYDSRGDEGFGSMCIKVLRPQWCPPGVGQPLLVVDIKGMCRSSQYSNAEGDDQTVDGDLSHVKRCRVDLHLAFVLCLVV
jgi:hypothetical protein